LNKGLASKSYDNKQFGMLMFPHSFMKEHVLEDKNNTKIIPLYTVKTPPRKEVNIKNHYIRDELSTKKRLKELNNITSKRPTFKDDKDLSQFKTKVYSQLKKRFAKKKCATFAVPFNKSNTEKNDKTNTFQTFLLSASINGGMRESEGTEAIFNNSILKKISKIGEFGKFEQDHSPKWNSILDHMKRLKESTERKAERIIDSKDDSGTSRKLIRRLPESPVPVRLSDVGLEDSSHIRVSREANYQSQSTNSVSRISQGRGKIFFQRTEKFIFSKKRICLVDIKGSNLLRRKKRIGVKSLTTNIFPDGRPSELTSCFNIVTEAKTQRKIPSCQNLLHLRKQELWDSPLQVVRALPLILIPPLTIVNREESFTCVPQRSFSTISSQVGPLTDQLLDHLLCELCADADFHKILFKSDREDTEKEDPQIDDDGEAVLYDTDYDVVENYLKSLFVVVNADSAEQGHIYLKLNQHCERDLRQEVKAASKSVLSGKSLPQTLSPIKILSDDLFGKVQKFYEVNLYSIGSCSSDEIKKRNHIHKVVYNAFHETLMMMKMERDFATQVRNASYKLTNNKRVTPKDCALILEKCREHVLESSTTSFGMLPETKQLLGGNSRDLEDIEKNLRREMDIDYVNNSIISSTRN